MLCRNLLGHKCSWSEEEGTHAAGEGTDVQLIGLRCNEGGSSWVELGEEKSLVASLPWGGRANPAPFGKYFQEPPSRGAGSRHSDLIGGVCR